MDGRRSMLVERALIEVFFYAVSPSGKPSLGLFALKGHALLSCPSVSKVHGKPERCFNKLCSSLELVTLAVLHCDSN